MGETAHHYLVFETTIGFCGIAWNEVGITRFRLPTRSAEAAKRILLRRMPDAEFGEPTPEVVEAIAAVKRYFEGKETDFSGFKLDLSDQDSFSSRSMLLRDRSDGVTRLPMGGWRRKSVPGQKPRVMWAKPWPRIRWG